MLIVHGSKALSTSLIRQLVRPLSLIEPIDRSHLAFSDRVLIREIVDYVCEIWQEPDLSIWEVRGQEQNFLYSKVSFRNDLYSSLVLTSSNLEQVMLWVAMDRGLRLADKRSLPCPNRAKWLASRDALYDEIQTKG